MVRKLKCLLVLSTEELGSRDHVLERGTGLGPLAGLETTVGIDPELVGLEELEHLLNADLDLLLGRNTGRVDVVDTGSDVARVGLILEDAEELGIGLGVLDGKDIGIEGGDGVEEVLELRVTEVRVDLSVVVDTGGGETERLDGPVEVGNTLGAGAERETLTESGLIDLDDLDTGGLEVNNLVAEGKGELLSLDGLVDIVTRERPTETGDRTSKHALHGAAGERSGVLGLLDGHGSGARDISNNDRRTDAARTVRLDPGVGGEDVTVEALTEVLHHVVTLGLSVDEDIEVKSFLLLDNELNLALDELLVLLGCDLALSELGASNTDLLGLRERTDGGGGELGELEVGLLGGDTGREGRLAVVHLGGDRGLALLDGGVVGARRGGTGMGRGSVGLELSADGVRAGGDGLGNDGNLLGLLGGEREPVGNLSGELLLGSKSVRGVEERRRSGNDNAVFAESLDGLLDGLNGLLEVGLPDVTTINDTGGENLTGSKGGDNPVELLRSTDEIDVDGGNLGEAGEDVQVVDDVTEVGGNGELGDLGAEGSELGVSGAEGGLGLLGEIEDKDGLIDLDGGGTGLGKLDEELLVDGQELLKEGDGIDGSITVGLSEVEERDGSNQDGAGGDTLGLGLKELPHGLGVGSEGKGLVVLEGRADVMVVRVEPFNHFLIIECQQGALTTRQVQLRRLVLG